MPRTENLSKLLEIIDKIIKDENDQRTEEEIWSNAQLEKYGYIFYPE